MPSPTRGASPASTHAVDATAPHDRIAVLDILRGFALLGMLMVHIGDATPDARTAWESAIETAIELFVSERSFATFAFLFGVGFAIQLRRAESRGAPFVRIYLRRLAVLFLFGFAAHALFGYNVLIGYSLYALPLLLIRNWSTRALLLVAAIALSSWAIYNIALGAYEWWTLGPAGAGEAYLARWKPGQAMREMLDAAQAQPNFLALVAARLRHMAWFYRQPWMFLPGTIALFVLGLLAVRHGVFDAPRRHTRLIVSAMVIGFVAWAAALWLLPRIPAFAPAGVVNPLRYFWRLGWGLMPVYVGAVLLLVAWRPHWERRLAPLGWTGRMALTNYFLQIMAVDVTVSAYGLGLGELPVAAIIPGTLLFFAGQILVSRWWLSRFRFGPLEWVWRSATYGRAAPLRRAVPGVATAA